MEKECKTCSVADWIFSMFLIAFVFSIGVSQGNVNKEIEMSDRLLVALKKNSEQRIEFTKSVEKYNKKVDEFKSAVNDFRSTLK